jgi:hypothetical protein
MILNTSALGFSKFHGPLLLQSSIDIKLGLVE